MPCALAFKENAVTNQTNEFMMEGSEQYLCIISYPLDRHLFVVQLLYLPNSKGYAYCFTNTARLVVATG